MGQGTTPNIVRIFIKSNPQNQQERNQNTILSRVRCPVEGFFGTLRQLFKLLRQPFKFCHSTFDLHVDNMIMLTNEHLRLSELNNEDLRRHKALIEQRIQQSQTVAVERKRKNRESYLRRLGRNTMIQNKIFV